MSTTERTTRLVARISVLRADGSRDTVQEWGDFIRVTPLSGPPSNWARCGGRLKLRGQPVNETGDPGKLQVAMTGELLTVVHPGQSGQ